MRRPPVATAVCAAAAAALLAGCGVPESGVVEAGGPATTIVYPDTANRLLLFFLSPEGRPTPVLRDTGVYDEHAPPVQTAKLLSALLQGPRPDESAAGLTTGLPVSGGPVDVASSLGTVRVTLPFPVRDLKDGAVSQLICTTAYAEARNGDAEVTLTGRDGTLPPARCAGIVPLPTG
ncbi:hypothetical protein [Streptomyces sp. NPDC001070]